MLLGLETLTRRLEIVFAVHPRTRDRIERFGLARVGPGVRMVLPLGYLETIGLVESSALVITDSGGLQEETTVLGVPCLTARPNTERPVTVTEGTNPLDNSSLAGTPFDNITPSKVMVNARFTQSRGLWWAEYGVRAQGTVTRVAETLLDSPFLIAQDLLSLDGFAVHRLGWGVNLLRGRDRVAVTFTWTEREAAYQNELGIFLVDDEHGRVAGKLPGDPGYANAALTSPGRQVVFTSGQTAGAVNPDAFDHFQYAQLPGGVAEYRVEDLVHGGDRDFNDMVFTISSGL